MISSYLRQYYCHEIKILTYKPGTTVLEARGLNRKGKFKREKKGMKKYFSKGKVHKKYIEEGEKPELRNGGGGKGTVLGASLLNSWPGNREPFRHK